MTRARRTRILVDGHEGLRARLAAAVTAAADVHEVSAPTEGLVMLTTRDTARGVLFHLGELLVTEARARIGTVVGTGLAAGSCPEKAWQLAVIDAAYRASLPITGGWDTDLRAEERRLQVERSREEAGIAATRVSFETMDLT